MAMAADKGWWRCNFFSLALPWALREVPEVYKGGLLELRLRQKSSLVPPFSARSHSASASIPRYPSDCYNWHLIPRCIYLLPTLWLSPDYIESMPRATTKSRSTATPTRTSPRRAGASSASQPYPKTKPEGKSKGKASTSAVMLPPPASDPQPPVTEPHTHASDTPFPISPTSSNVEAQSRSTGRKSRRSKTSEPMPKPGDANYNGRRDHIYPDKPDGLILMAYYLNVSERPSDSECAKLAEQVGR